MHWIGYYLSLLHSRLVYSGLLAFGLLLLFLAGRAEYTGVTFTSNGSRRSPSVEVSRELNPDLFRREIARKCIQGALWLAAGLMVRGIHQWANRIDPFSEDFAGIDSLEDLEQVLDKKIKMQNRPDKL